MAKVSACDLQTLNNVIQKWIDVSPKHRLRLKCFPSAVLLLLLWRLPFRSSCHDMKVVQINCIDNAGRRGRTGLAFRGAAREDFAGKEGYYNSDC